MILNFLFLITANTVIIIINQKSKIMGSGQFQVPERVNKQWEETFVGDRKYLRNKITLEMFEFMVLQKVAQTHNISQLIERSIYCIPKTPKIIILNDQICQLFILVQQFDQNLAEYLAKIILATDLLEFIQQIMTVTECLFKRYGPFHLTERMIGLNKNRDIIVWIHQQKQKNNVQFPLAKGELSQQIMIDQILQIIKMYSSTSFFYEELKNNSHNFSNLNKALPEIIRKSKIQMLRKLSGGELREKRLSRAISPQNSFGSMRQYLIRSPKNADNPSKVQKRNQIPKFIKSMKQKKNNLLDSLNHKRTMTIEEIEAYHAKKGGGSNNFIKQSRDRSPSKSLAKIRSSKGSPRKERGSNFSYGEISKISFPTSSNTQAFEYLTSSGSSSNYIIKKRDFNETKTAKTCQIQPLSAKVTKNNFTLTPSYTESKLIYQWYQVNEQSCILQSFQKNPVQANVKGYFEVNSKNPLGEMCANIAESKYFNEISKNKQVIVEEQSPSISKTLEDQFNDFFSSPNQSPRFILEGMPQSTELTQEFSKIIDF